MLSGLAKMDFKSTCEIANEKHMQPWAEMCKARGRPLAVRPAGPATAAVRARREAYGSDAVQRD